MARNGVSCELSASDLRLEGWFTQAASGARAGAVVAPPHPLYGGLLTNRVVTAAAEGFAAAGASCMAFNYRGTGASQGSVTDDPGSSVADYTGALDALAERVPGPYLAAGYSFGSRAALAVASADPRVLGAVLVAPPVDMIGAQDFAAFEAGPLLVIVGDRDSYAPLDRLRAALAARPDARLEVIDGADHFFGSGTSAITALVATVVPGWL